MMEKGKPLWPGCMDFGKVEIYRTRGLTMGQTHYRATEVAETLSKFIKADLAEDPSLAMIHRKFPGISREELLRVFAICQDDAVLEYERSQELLANMRETTLG